MSQLPLFRTLSGVALTAVYEAPHGWRLVVASRFEGEPWSDSDRSDYSHMVTSELADVISIEVSRRLGEL